MRPISLRDFAPLAFEGVGDGSVCLYSRTFRRWIEPIIGRSAVAVIGPDDVRAVLAGAADGGAAPATRGLVLAVLRKILRTAVGAGLRQSDPTAGVRVTGLRRESVAKVLTAAEADRLHEALFERVSTAARALRVLLATGLRVGELLALQTRDVDLAESTIFVRKSKTPAGVRTVDVPDRVMPALRLLVEGHPPGAPIFDVSRSALRATLAAACAAAGVPRLRIHDLRHTRITLLLVAGVPVGVVSKQAGHESVAFTLATYDHWIPAADRETRRKWANA